MRRQLCESCPRRTGRSRRDCPRCRASRTLFAPTILIFFTIRRFGFSTDEGYRRFSSLVAHEYFHLWNVKRIRPDALGPFDYTKENYTRLLWVAEGITEYYSHLMLRRAGLISNEAYLDHLAK